ncbi:hypothetical protein Hanom_Chr11g01033781 [Helianthus anomalus]
MIEGIDLQAARKKSKVRCLASCKVAEFGGTFTLIANAIFPVVLDRRFVVPAR